MMYKQLIRQTTANTKKKKHMNTNGNANNTNAKKYTTNKHSNTDDKPTGNITIVLKTRRAMVRRNVIINNNYGKKTQRQ